MSTATLRTTVELRDLGAVRPEWSGILSPMYADEQVHKYIHDQFLDSAAQYVERYQNTNY